jgi:putative protease
LGTQGITKRGGCPTGNSLPEILAPAGSFASVQAAVSARCDAVYIGGERYSARSNAKNFTDTEIADVCNYCHTFGVNVYIAANTILFDSELQDFADFIYKAVKSGVDAFIIQDPAALEIIRKISPEIPIHASTQMTVFDRSGALFLQRNGFSRVVLARELEAAQITEITENSDIETEIFVSGALCMSVSGQCYMSAFFGGRSANRGNCAQACRLPFCVDRQSGENCLSLKDLSLLDHIDRLKEMRITSLKIEGRMKRPEYVFAAVRRLYNALHGVNEEIPETFSRSGFTDGYFTGECRDMFGIRTKTDVSESASAEKFIAAMMNNTRRTVKADFFAEIRADKRSRLTLTANGITVTSEGEIPVSAQKRELTTADLEVQLTKTGETSIECKTFNAICDAGLFLPLSALNELRRKACKTLENELCLKNSPLHSAKPIEIAEITPKTAAKTSKTPKIRVTVKTLEQFQAAAREVTQIVIPVSLAEEIPPEKRPETILQMPRFCSLPENLEKLYEIGFRHTVIHNIGQIIPLRDLGFKLHGDFSLNISNSLSALFYSKYLEDFTASVECKFKQIPYIPDIKTNVIAYGKIPLMLVKNCPIKNSIGCKNCTKEITDRTGRHFDVVCSENYTEILNADVLDIAGKAEILSADILTLIFNNENANEIKDIISSFRDNRATKRQNITRGLYFRGVTDV